MPIPESSHGLRIDAAAVRMRRLLNEGMLAVLAGVGDRSGLLRALCAVQPANGGQIARAASLDERLVKGWLDAMVAGRIVDYDGVSATYTLPAEYTTFLAGAQGRAYCQGLGDLVDLAVATRGPRSRSHDDGPTPAAGDLVALVPGLGARLEYGARVLEVGCGTGNLARALAEAYPSIQCTGRDTRRGRILAARRLALEAGLTNANFRCGTGIPSGSDARFDIVVTLDENALAAADSVSRLHCVLVAGGCALLAMTATTGSPADDALHPLGAFLSGARALSRTRIAPPPSTEVGLRLAACGFEVSALVRIAGDPFRNFLIAHKPKLTTT